MKAHRLFIHLFTVLMLLVPFSRSAGDTTVDRSKLKTVQATVTAIDLTNRMLTLKGPDGELTVHVPESVKRFSAIKAGDVVTASYLDGLVFHVMSPNDTKLASSQGETLTPAPGKKPGGTISTQETARVTVMSIDLKVPSLTFKTQDGRTISYVVKDASRLKNLKPGDVIGIVYTQAVMVSVDSPKRKS